MEQYLRNFKKVYSKKINLHKEIADKDLRLIYGEYQKLYVVDDKDFINRTTITNYYHSLNIEKTMIYDSVVKFYYHYSDCIIYPYLEYKSLDEMYQEDIAFIKRYNYFLGNVTDSTLICKIEKIDNQYYVVYYINKKIIDYVKYNNKNTKVKMLTQILGANKKNEIIENAENELSNCYSLTTYEDVKVTPLKTPLKTPLFEYQKQTIRWMKEIEKSVDDNNNKIKYSYSPIFDVIDEYSYYNEELFPKGILNNNYTLYKTFKYNGGNLTSSVGLGKTLMMLTHILEDKLESDFVYFSDTCNYFYKRGANKGESCKKVVNGVYYCKSHEKSSFIDKRVLLYKNIDSFNITDYFGCNGLINTNANLIICPSHLCDQWAKEYYDKFDGTAKIVVIVTNDQYSNIRLSDIIFADIVIFSRNLLNSYTSKSTLKSIEEQIENGVCMETILNSTNYKSILNYNWKRVIIDEAHEPTDSIVIMIQSRYKWNITGTPFANGIQGFTNMMSNISNDCIRHCNKDNLNNLIEFGFNSNIIAKCKNLFRRDTQESIKDEYTGNIINEHLKLITFTDYERNIYDSYLGSNQQKSKDFLIQLCCHCELNNEIKDVIKNCKTFDEIQKVLLEHNQKTINDESNKIKIYEDQINYYMQELDSDSEAYDGYYEEINSRLTSTKRNLTNSKKIYEDTLRTFNYLKSAIEKLTEKESCPICLDDISDLAITKCGHKFCWDCIKTVCNNNNRQSYTNNFKCPQCNTLISDKSFYMLSDKQDIVSETDIDSLEGIIKKVKSSKIGNIIYFLKNNLKEDDKVILFSQWDSLLTKVGRIMNEYGIYTGYCSGSVYKKKLAIKEFSESKDKNLILLSSSNCASGINLTAANKIIFLEPVYGTPEYRKNIEEQASARANRIGQKRPIDIYRFIVKDTIEESIYNEL